MRTALKGCASSADNRSCCDRAGPSVPSRSARFSHLFLVRAVGMQQGISHKEAVRLAKESLGEATAQELAEYIKERFGLAILPPIVAVILGTFQERAAL